jgi:hypothetical protein
MEIKKLDLLRLHNAILALEGTQHSVKFSYLVAKNKVAMKDEIEALEEVSKSSEEFKVYEDARIKLAQKYADKNEDGSTKIQDNNFVLTINAEVFQKEFDKLKNKYKDTVADRDKQVKEFEELLEGTVVFEGTKINFGDIPASIDPATMECFILADLIVEEE